MMGMGYAANSDDVIDEKDLVELVPEEYAAFIDALCLQDVSIMTFASEWQWDGEFDDGVIDATFVEMQEGFKEVTGGLSLNICYHNSEDDGSRYDSVNGVYFSVDGMYQLTKEGERFKHIVSRRFYVMFG